MDALQKVDAPPGEQFAPFPSPPGALVRPRLLAALAGAEGRRLTLVVADSGYGKTTLLAQWARTLPPVAQTWYALRSSDGKPKPLERRFLDAARRFGEERLAQRLAG